MRHQKVCMEKANLRPKNKPHAASLAYITLYQGLEIKD